jgi:5-methylthioadenosine/S-adenosylhomocysteine deaminase
MNIDYLLTNALVLTMNEQFAQFEPGAVAVLGNQIFDVGLASEIEPKYTPAFKLDCQGKVLMPGLINAHIHAAMSLLRGLADDLRLDVWLMGYMMPVEREFVSPEFVELGTKLACAEMIKGGVTTFADMYYFEESVARIVAEIGMRAICSQTILKFPSPDAQFYEESLAMARDFITHWKNHDLIIPSVAPHAPYTCTPEILHAAVELAVEFDVPLHTHLAETETEVVNMREEQGMPVIPYVKKQNLFDAKVLAAHCVHVDDGEIRTLMRAGAGVSHNPSSNLKLASGISPVKKMIDMGVHVGIGTDGPASNNDLDMFEEMRLAAFLAKSSTGDPTALPARTIITMATRMGAQALHLGNMTGSIRPGKRADLILINLSAFHNAPRFRRDPNGPYAQIVYAGKATDVTDVMVNGKWLMRDCQLLTINQDDLLYQSQDFARRIDLFLIKREQSVLSKLIAIGGAMEEESFEVQIKVVVQDPQIILMRLAKGEIEILRSRHYHEFDTYFFFTDPDQGLLRYREDDFIGENGQVTNVRSRLTLIGHVREGQFPQKVLLSRSRYLAPATHSLRFYREYFMPSHEEDVQKDRLRYLVHFGGTEFFVNIDHLIKPEKGYFLEVKSRTWSKQDAERKSRLAVDLISYLGLSTAEAVTADYFEIISDERKKPD